MDSRSPRGTTLRIAALAVVAGVAACGGGEPDRRAAVEIRGTDPAPGAAAGVAVAPAQPAAAPDARGVISYGSYSAVVARQGDTVTELARRVGLSASELAAYNGLTPAHTLRAGDELVLPARPGGYDATETEIAAAAPAPSVVTEMTPAEASGIETAPLPGAETAVEVEAAADIAAPTPSAPSAAEPAPSRPAGEPWSPDLAAAAIERSSGLEPDGSLGAPPSAADPVPPEPPARRELESPDLGQYQTGEVGTTTAPPPSQAEIAAASAAATPAAAGPNVRLRRPVEGPVAVGFNKGAGPARNDGVDFAAPAGAPVVAAADGEVALVSQSLGGLGTIVLLRHPNDLLTVYGRIDGVTVSKGDIVQAGQQIGTVSNAAAPAEPRMHFEVRRGAESLDPMQFL